MRYEIENVKVEEALLYKESRKTSQNGDTTKTCRRKRASHAQH